MTYVVKVGDHIVDITATKEGGEARATILNTQYQSDEYYSEPWDDSKSWFAGREGKRV